MKILIDFMKCYFSYVYFTGRTILRESNIPVVFMLFLPVLYNFHNYPRTPHTPPSLLSPSTLIETEFLSSPQFF